LDEATCMLQEGVEAELIEAAATATGRTLGPLATLDETGIELNLQQARQAKADGLPAHFRRLLAEPVLRALVEAASWGRFLRLAVEREARAVDRSQDALSARGAPARAALAGGSLAGGRSSRSYALP
jgi:3-hydroxyacyl-CoA dehydrogenase